MTRKQSRMGIVGGNRSMFKVWMDMLASMGGVFKPFVPEPDKEPKLREHVNPVRLRHVDMKNYKRSGSGVITRITPKRDKSISARQWKKRVKSQRACERARREAVAE